LSLGKKMLNEEKIPADVFPTSMVQKGNYALAITWSDGHRSSIYTFEKLMSNEFV
jgi:DUF971 family protein